MMVPESITGSRNPASSKTSSTREDRGLGVEGVEDGLDQEQVDAAVDEAACRLAVGRAELVEGDVARPRVVRRPARCEAVRFVGPSAPATQRGRPSRALAAASAASRASRAAAAFISRAT